MPKTCERRPKAVAWRRLHAICALSCRNKEQKKDFSIPSPLPALCLYNIHSENCQPRLMSTYVFGFWEHRKMPTRQNSKNHVHIETTNAKRGKVSSSCDQHDHYDTIHNSRIFTSWRAPIATRLAHTHTHTHFGTDIILSRDSQSVSRYWKRTLPRLVLRPLANDPSLPNTRPLRPTARQDETLNLQDLCYASQHTMHLQLPHHNVFAL